MVDMPRVPSNARPKSDRRASEYETGISVYNAIGTIDSPNCCKAPHNELIYEESSEIGVSEVSISPVPSSQR